MSLFATDKTIKIYFDETGEIVEKETDLWVEVLEELPAYLDLEFKKSFSNGRIIVKSDGSYETDLSALTGNINYSFLVKVMRGWSEPVPINVENIRKVKSTVVWNLWNKLQELYGYVKTNEEG